MLPHAPRSHAPAGQRHDARNRHQQRALAGAIRANDRGHATGRELAADCLEGKPPSIAYAHVVQHDAAICSLYSAKRNHSPLRPACGAQRLKS